jgi:hypothetical protein
MFPPFFVIVGVREHKPNVHHLPGVVDLRNQAVLVALDIEDRTFTARISMRKVTSRLNQIAPCSFLRHVIPIRERLFRIRMYFPKFSQWSLADDTHQQPPLACSHNGNFPSRGFVKSCSENLWHGQINFARHKK